MRVQVAHPGRPWSAKQRHRNPPAHRRLLPTFGLAGEASVARHPSADVAVPTVTSVFKSRLRSWTMALFTGRPRVQMSQFPQKELPTLAKNNGTRHEPGSALYEEKRQKLSQSYPTLLPLFAYPASGAALRAERPGRVVRPRRSAEGCKCP